MQSLLLKTSDRTDEGHEFGTSITRKGLDPLYGKELMGIKSDKVYERYTQGALKQAAELRLLAGDL